MAKHFDPRKVLKQISKALLREFFQRRGELSDLPWDTLTEAAKVDAVYEAWQRLPDIRRRQTQLIFQDLVELGDDRGMKVLAEEIQASCPQRKWEFISCSSRLNKALWFYLNLPEAFERAALFARADALSVGRYAVRRNSLPKEPLNVTPATTSALERALHAYYWPNEMRGRHCHVAHYQRAGGSQYFFAYLDDWPDSRLVFEDNGDLESHCQRYAFSVLFVACPQDGCLELVAKGGRAVQYPLQQAFCKSVLGLDIGPADPLRPEYQLQQVLDPEFRYPTEPGDCIARVRLSRIRLQPVSQSRKVIFHELKFSPKVLRTDWIHIIQRQLDGHGMTAADVVVKQASFQLVFVDRAVAGARTLTFTVSLPNTCDLKSKPDNVREIGERCLQRWGMINA